MQSAEDLNLHYEGEGYIDSEILFLLANYCYLPCSQPLKNFIIESTKQDHCMHHESVIVSMQFVSESKPNTSKEEQVLNVLSDELIRFGNG